LKRQITKRQTKMAIIINPVDKGKNEALLVQPCHSTELELLTDHMQIENQT
jgi:hypothetical protein